MNLVFKNKVVAFGHKKRCNRRQNINRIPHYDDHLLGIEFFFDSVNIEREMSFGQPNKIRITDDMCAN